MLNDYIKKLIIILLSIVTVYLLFLLLPNIVDVFTFIFKILLPFLIAFAIAFILQPLVCFFQDRGVSRGYSVLIVLLIFVLVVAFIISITVPHLTHEINTFIDQVPELTSQIKEMLNNFSERFSFLPDGFKPNYDNINAFINDYILRIESFPEKLFNYLTRIIGLLIIIPIILVYFLLDYEKILCNIRDYLTKTKRIRFKNYLADLNKIMGAYFRGVFIVIVIVSIAFSIAFSIIDLEFAVFFGIFIGITNIIPYLGSFIGASLPFLFALTESPQKAILVIIISLILQTIESDVISPCVQSRKIKIHPLIVILGLIFFGTLFGILGMILAVPILSIIKITLKHYPIKINNQMKKM